MEQILRHELEEEEIVLSKGHICWSDPNYMLGDTYALEEVTDLSFRAGSLIYTLNAP